MKPHELRPVFDEQDDQGRDEPTHHLKRVGQGRERRLIRGRLHGGDLLSRDVNAGRLHCGADYSVFASSSYR